MEDGDGAEGKGNDGDKKVDERLLEIKELIDTGDCEMGDIRDGYYVDYLRHAASFRADIAHNKKAAIQMPGVEYSMLSTWQRGGGLTVMARVGACGRASLRPTPV